MSVFCRDSASHMYPQATIHAHSESDWASKTQEGHLVTVSLKMVPCGRYMVGVHVQSCLCSLWGNRLQLLSLTGPIVTWWYIFIRVSATVLFLDFSFSVVSIFDQCITKLSLSMNLLYGCNFLQQYHSFIMKFWQWSCFKRALKVLVIDWCND